MRRFAVFAMLLMSSCGSYTPDPFLGHCGETQVEAIGFDEVSATGLSPNETLASFGEPSGAILWSDPAATTTVTLTSVVATAAWEVTDDPNANQITCYPGETRLFIDVSWDLQLDGFEVPLMENAEGTLFGRAAAPTEVWVGSHGDRTALEMVALAETLTGNPGDVWAAQILIQGPIPGAQVELYITREDALTGQTQNEFMEGIWE